VGALTTSAEGPESQLFWTRSGVRLRRRGSRSGTPHWLLLPGGPGIGSDSLEELVDTADLPGTAWLVDLPGDGSNRDAPGAGPDPYAQWPTVLLEAARAVPDPVFVGHSTGGMYLLSTPALAQVLRGMVLISSAPDAGWREGFLATVRAHPLPEVDAATAAYEREPTDEHLARLAVASAPWNFPAPTLEVGAALLARMPYHGGAVAWSAEHFDDDYRASWWPERLPCLVVSGSDDRIVDQSAWQRPQFAGRHVLHRTIRGGGHWPWLDAPEQVRGAFADFAPMVCSTGGRLAVPPDGPQPG
jgi:pimeloyl-ACP methyl ester carboxylesterase